MSLDTLSNRFTLKKRFIEDFSVAASKLFSVILFYTIRKVF